MRFIIKKYLIVASILSFSLSFLFQNKIYYIKNNEPIEGPLFWNSKTNSKNIEHLNINPVKLESYAMDLNFELLGDSNSDLKMVSIGDSLDTFEFRIQQINNLRYLLINRYFSDSIREECSACKNFSTTVPLESFEKNNLKLVIYDYPKNISVLLNGSSVAGEIPSPENALKYFKPDSIIGFTQIETGNNSNTLIISEFRAAGSDEQKTLLGTNLKIFFLLMSILTLTASFERRSGYL